MESKEAEGFVGKSAAAQRDMIRKMNILTDRKNSSRKVHAVMKDLAQWQGGEIAKGAHSVKLAGIDESLQRLLDHAEGLRDTLAGAKLDREADPAILTEIQGKVHEYAADLSQLGEVLGDRQKEAAEQLTTIDAETKEQGKQLAKCVKALGDIQAVIKAAGKTNTETLEEMTTTLARQTASLSGNSTALKDIRAAVENARSTTTNTLAEIKSTLIQHSADLSNTGEAVTTIQTLCKEAKTARTGEQKMLGQLDEKLSKHTTAQGQIKEALGTITAQGQKQDEVSIDIKSTLKAHGVKQSGISEKLESMTTELDQQSTRMKSDSKILASRASTEQVGTIVSKLEEQGRSLAVVRERQENMSSSNQVAGVVDTLGEHTDQLAAIRKHQDDLPSAQQVTAVATTLDDHTKQLAAIENRQKSLPGLNEVAEITGFLADHTCKLLDIEQNQHDLASGEQMTGVVHTLDRQTEDLATIRADQARLPSAQQVTGIATTLGDHTDKLDTLYIHQGSLARADQMEGVTSTLDQHGEELAAIRRHQDDLPLATSVEAMAQTLNQQGDRLAAVQSKQELQASSAQGASIITSLDRQKEQLEAVQSKQDLLASSAQGVSILTSLEAVQSKQDLLASSEQGASIISSLDRQKEQLEAVRSNQDLLASSAQSASILSSLGRQNEHLAALRSNQSLLASAAQGANVIFTLNRQSKHLSAGAKTLDHHSDLLADMKGLMTTISDERVARDKVSELVGEVDRLNGKVAEGNQSLSECNGKLKASERNLNTEKETVVALRADLATVQEQMKIDDMDSHSLRLALDRYLEELELAEKQHDEDAESALVLHAALENQQGVVAKMEEEQEGALLLAAEEHANVTSELDKSLKFANTESERRRLRINELESDAQIRSSEYEDLEKAKREVDRQLSESQKYREWRDKGLEDLGRVFHDLVSGIVQVEGFPDETYDLTALALATCNKLLQKIEELSNAQQHLNQANERLEESRQRVRVLETQVKQLEQDGGKKAKRVQELDARIAKVEREAKEEMSDLQGKMNGEARDKDQEIENLKSQIEQLQLDNSNKDGINTTLRAKLQETELSLALQTARATVETEAAEFLFEELEDEKKLTAFYKKLAQKMESEDSPIIRAIIGKVIRQGRPEKRGQGDEGEAAGEGGKRVRDAEFVAEDAEAEFADTTMSTDSTREAASSSEPATLGDAETGQPVGDDTGAAGEAVAGEGPSV